MTQLKRRKVIKGLRLKQFIRIQEKKNDIWYILTIDGKIVPEVKTFVSGGGKQQMIYEDNIHKMISELNLDNKKQFKELIECTYLYDDYIEDLRNNKIIKFNNKGV
ncbi:hypothetical protein LCGC14_0900730 [marine sediment metagenome]|uniref:Uncharacterized protein n=1 Tax=marine sediment metagenome TaxID=412755 RepID=A0A0F9S3G5_9ZZZZ